MLIKSLRYSLLLPLLMVFATMQPRAQESSEQQLTNVTLQLKWKHQFQFAGYYAAIEQGFYEDAGLNVHLLEAQEDSDPSETILNGEAQFGVTTSDIVRLRSQGKDLVLLASIFQHSPQILVALKSSGIDHVQSLQNKKISMEHNAADIIAFMNDEGISLNEVALYPHSFGIEQLLNGEVDALTAYKSDEPFLLSQSGKEYIIIDPGMGGIDFYGDVLFTTGELVKTHPELVLRFREATLKGWQYAMNHTEEIVQLIYNNYSDRHSIEHLQFEADKMQRLIMPDVVEIGYSNPGRWQHILDIYKAQNLLEQPMTLDGLFYTDYLKPERTIPWQIIIIFSVILLMVISVTLFYYFTTQKLKAESERRQAVQHELIESEKRLRELNASKDRFYSIIAHDLRNPFSAILGFTELIMLDVKKDPKNIRLETLEIIKETILHTSELLNNLLLWSRNQIGNIEYQPEVFQLKSAISKSVDIVKAQASHKHINIDVIGDDYTIFADPNMIKTILRNLLTNAIKFTEKNGQVSIILTSDETHCIIAVKDTGVGISPENISKLFAIDSKFVNYGTEAEHGTGLGLLLCKEFIEKHSGTIEVSSTTGEGSTFTVSLPRFKNF